MRKLVGSMFLMMFKQPERVALAYSPIGGGNGCPAWDYAPYIPDAEVGRTYAWDVCLVVKPFAGRSDVLSEVRKYLGSDDEPAAPTQTDSDLE